MSDDEITVTLKTDYHYTELNLSYDDGYEYTINFQDYSIFCNTVSVKAVLAMLYRLIFFLCFIGNGLVVFVFVKYRKLTNLTNICLLNLALSDLLVVLTLPFWSHDLVVGQWTFGGLLCSLTSGFQYTGFFSSFFFMIALMLDRYMVIMHSHTAAHYRTVRFGIALTVVVWMLSLGLALPRFIFTKVRSMLFIMDAQTCGYITENFAWELYRVLVINITGFVIPLLLMIVCCSRIIPTLVKTRTTKKHRMLKLIITIVVLFFVFWTPFNIVLFLRFLDSMGQLEGDYCALYVPVLITETLAYFYCCLKPIIYTFVGQKFMKMRLAAAEEMDT